MEPRELRVASTLVPVVSGSEAAALEAATIERGTPSTQLMQRAGSAAAEVISRTFAPRISGGVAIFTGGGNNGGDGWVVAGALAEKGVTVQVVEIAAARTRDASAARDQSLSRVQVTDVPEPAAIVVDALLGTGARGAPRAEMPDAIRRINSLRDAGATVVALDLPSGVDATTGEHGDCVRADLTVTFGSVKRGQLLARDACGEIVAVDIGLETGGALNQLPGLVDRAWVTSRVPAIPFDAQKGTRGHLAIVAGGEGMPGAAILAGRGALRAGAGVLRMLVHEKNLAAVANAIPSALIMTWPADDDALRKNLGDWSGALVIGPGLGPGPEVRALVERVLRATEAPVILDADGLSAFAEDTGSLAKLLNGRKALITPHPGEMARLLGIKIGEVLEQRFEIGAKLARDLGATVLLKGTPTVVSSPAGKRYCVARGTAALATGGSGDLLSGICGALLAQTQDTDASGCAGAWIHGRAAEICTYVRGTTLEDVLFAMPRAWNEREPENQPPVLTRLPAAP